MPDARGWSVLRLTTGCRWLLPDRVASVVMLVLMINASQVLAEQIHDHWLSVEIIGLQDEMLANAKASLSLLQTDPGQQPPELRIRALFARAEQELRVALQPFGYYRSTIVSELVAPQASETTWRCRFEVTLGPPTRIAELDLQWDQAGELLQGQFPLAIGDVLDHRLYRQGKQALLRQAKSAGYLKADWLTHRIEIDPRLDDAVVRLHLDSGPLHRFYGARFRQQGFREDYLRSFLPLRKGDTFTLTAEAELRHALVASGHFERVEIQRLTPLAQDPAAVEWLIELQPRKPNRYRAGLGWGTDTGVGVGLDWTRRNLWQQGHRLDVGLRLVEVKRRQVGEINYRIPSDPLFNQNIEFFARHQGKDQDYQDSGLTAGGQTRIINRTLGLRLPRSRRLWEGLNLQERFSLFYLAEQYDLFDVVFGDLPEPIQYNFATALGSDREILRADYKGLVMAADWSYLDTDDPLYARHANHLEFSLKASHPKLGSNFEMGQVDLQGTRIRPLGKGRLLSRGQWVYSLAKTRSVLGLEVNQMPEFYESRTGGDRSVRGFGYQEISPAASFTGGKHLWTASIEYEYPIFDDWNIAAFVDSGSAFNRFSRSETAIGSGLGVRWRSPVGSVRFDLALPLTEAESDFQIHLSIGPEF